MAKEKNVTVALKGMSIGVTAGSVAPLVFQPLPDDHPAYGIIGLITSECARIEHFLDATIFQFVGLQSQARMGTCITGQMFGMFPRYQALHQLALETGAPAQIRTEIAALEQASNDVAKRRNRVIHDAWMQETDSKELAQFRTKNKKETAFGPTPVHLDALKADLAYVREHLRRVMKLNGDVWNLYQPIA